MKWEAAAISRGEHVTKGEIPRVIRGVRGEIGGHVVLGGRGVGWRRGMGVASTNAPIVSNATPGARALCYVASRRGVRVVV